MQQCLAELTFTTPYAEARNDEGECLQDALSPETIRLFVRLFQTAYSKLPNAPLSKPPPTWPPVWVVTYHPFAFYSTPIHPTKGKLKQREKRMKDLKAS